MSHVPDRLSVQDLVDDAADELGLDVQRFRLAAGADADNLYLTGIEFALAAAAVVVARFMRGAVRGATRRAQERGVTPEQLGERAARKVVDLGADRLDALIGRAEAVLHDPDPPQEQRDAIVAELDTLVAEARPMVDDVLADGDVADAAADIEAFLRDNGIPAEQASGITERLLSRLIDDWGDLSR